MREKTARGAGGASGSAAVVLRQGPCRSALQTRGHPCRRRGRAAAPPHRGAFQGCPGEWEACKGCTAPTAAPKREPPVWAVRVMIPMVLEEPGSPRVAPGREAGAGGPHLLLKGLWRKGRQGAEGPRRQSGDTARRQA